MESHKSATFGGKGEAGTSAPQMALGYMADDLSHQAHRLLTATRGQSSPVSASDQGD